MTARPFIPVSEPDIGELELRYVTEAVRSGWVSSIGPFVERFEAEFARFCQVKHAVAVSNGTTALHLALLALGVGPGDEVIIPDLTFVATGNAVLYCGAKPVLVDVTAETWCIDPALVEKAITSRTKVILPVHLYGHPADMEAILALARPRGIAVVEDAAEAHGAKCRGKVVGGIGDIGCFSFYGNKILTTGEGGMVTTNDDRLAARVRFLKDHAMDPTRRYFHPEVGYNYRMTNVQAALGCAQLERAEELLAKRRRVMEAYRDALAGLDGVQLNPHAPWADPVPWMVCLVQDRVPADVLAARLRDQGIDTRPFFVPLHDLPAFHDPDTGTGPVAGRLSCNGLNLPSSPRIEAGTSCRLGGAIQEVLS